MILNVFARVKARIQKTFFPTIIDREIHRWYKDGGDKDLRFNYQLKPGSIVFDVGGFEGEFASQLYSRMPCKILCFEPVKKFSAKLTDLFQFNPDINVFDYGLSSQDQNCNIFVEGPGSSVHRKSSLVEEISLRDVVKVVSELKIECIDLFKINIEGGEYEVLPRLIDSGLIKHIENLQIQFHKINSDSVDLKNKIRNALKETHDCHYCYEFIWEDWRIKKPFIKGAVEPFK